MKSYWEDAFGGIGNSSEQVDMVNMQCLDWVVDVHPPMPADCLAGRTVGGSSSTNTSDSRVACILYTMNECSLCTTSTTANLCQMMRQ